MATKRKKKTTQEKPEIFAVSPEQRKKLLGILISVFSILIFISVLSYSGFDKANLKSELTDVSNSKDIHNAIGVLGAYMSDFLINSTIGYFSIVIPVIIFIWGFSLLKKFTFKTLIVTSNFLLLSAILLASFFGILRLRLNMFTADSVLSGAAGRFSRQNNFKSSWSVWRSCFFVHCRTCNYDSGV